MKKVSKELKEKGKVVIDGPNVKARKKSAPAVQVHKSKKKYDRKEPIEETSDIAKFVECVIQKKYADATKYLQREVESKIQGLIAKEINTPLF